MITGKTFTAQYDGLEDRIRLILNYADPARRIDLMITRAMFLRLTPVFEQLLPHGATAIRPLRGDTPSEAGFEPTDHATLELTQQRQLLLQKVDFNMHKEGERVTLLFYGASQDKPVAQTTLTIDGLEQVTGIILGAIPFISWAIAPNILEH